MQCTSPITLVEQDNMIVPCGKCLSCRIKKRQEWAMRMLHERDSWKDSLFLTLTYDNDHLPIGSKGLPTLKKEHLRNFIKRIRHHLRIQYFMYKPGTKKPLKRYFEYKLRYFACGEYGEETQRPHYHAIIFGLSQFGEHRELIKKQWPYCDWKNRTIEQNCFGSAEPDSMRYVSQYIDKKFNNDYGQEIYEDLGREPVFKFASNGIGRDWCLKNEYNIIKKKYLTMNGTKLSLPRYYINLLGLDISDLKQLAREKEKRIMNSIIGSELSLEEVYRYLTTEEVKHIDGVLKKQSLQRDKNVIASLKNKKSKKM
jgi:hypothetical protein